MSGRNDEPTPATGEPAPMTEETTPQEPAAEEATRVSRLTERLLARAAHPLGLIDVRRAERHHARVMDWLAARTPLVEHLMSRYGLAEGEGPAALGLAFADAHESEEAVNLYAAPDRFTPRAAEHLFTAVAQIPDDSAAQIGAKRITRRGVPTFSHAGPETDSAARQERHEVAGRERSGVVRQGRVEDFEPGRSEDFRPARGRAGPNQEQARGPLSLSPAKEIPTANAVTPASRDAVQTPRGRAARAPSEESTPAPTQTVARRPARRPIPSVEERATFSTDEQDKTLARGSTVVNETKDATVASEPRGATKPDASSVSESSGARTRPPATPPRAPAGVRENMSAADAEFEEKELTLRRNVDGRGTRRSTSEAAGERVLVASEIPAGDPGRESPSLRAQSPLPLASSPPAPAREEAARGQNVSASVAASPPPAAETFTHGHGRAGGRAEEVNVERLTEQVSRHLARRLLVERERRGLGRR